MAGSESSRELIARRRRMTLEIRTVTLTLRAALAELDLSSELSEEAARFRTEWCAQARHLLDEVRARSFKMQRLSAEVEARDADPVAARRATEAAMTLLDDADAELIRLERTA
jgi:hypothetical protein